MTATHHAEGLHGFGSRTYGNLLTVLSEQVYHRFNPIYVTWITDNQSGGESNPESFITCSMKDHLKENRSLITCHESRTIRDTDE